MDGLNVTLEAAIKQLDITNDNHWTADGLPRIETIKFLTGNTTITRDVIEAALPGFKRQNALVEVPVAETVSVVTEPVVEVIAEPIVEPVAAVEPVVEAIAKPVLAEVVAEPVKPVTLQDQLEFEEANYEDIQAELKEVNARLEAKGKEVQDLKEFIQIELGVETSQEAINKYLESQKEQLQIRADRIRMIASSGINLKELSEGLKSPLDSRLSRKKK